MIYCSIISYCTDIMNLQVIHADFNIYNGPTYVLVSVSHENH